MYKMSYTDYTNLLDQNSNWSNYKFKSLVVQDPDTALLAAVTKIRRLDGLITVGFALKAQANPNLYVSGNNGQKLHLLVYAYLVHQQNQNLLAKLLRFLIFAGSDPKLPYESKSLGKQNDNISVTTWLNQRGALGLIEMKPNNKIQIGTTTKTQTVKEQVSRQVYNPVTGLSEVIIEERLVDRPVETGEFITERELFSIFMDQPLNLISSNLETLLVKSFSTVLLHKLIIKKFTDSELFTYGLIFYNMDAWVYFCSLGMLPGYFLVSGILHRIREETLSEKLQFMTNLIIVAVNRGLILDAEQVSILNNKPEYQSQLLSNYNKPYWSKVCTVTEGPIPDQLQSLNQNLELRANNRRSLCQELGDRSNWAPERIKTRRNQILFPGRNSPPETHIRSYENNLTKPPTSYSEASEIRLPTPEPVQLPTPEATEQLRVKFAAAELTQVQSYNCEVDFIVEEVMVTGNPSKVCTNSTLSGKDPLEEYSSLLIVTFVDENEQIYCFTPENYQEIVATKKNPYTSLNLPNYIIDQVVTKQSLLKSLNYLPTDYNPETPDQPTDTQSIKLYELIPTQYKQLNYDQTLRFLNSHMSHDIINHPYSINNLKYALGYYFYELNR